MKQTSLILILLFATGVVANAATYYVAKTGNDSNPGTSTSPWLTIGHAVSVAAAGDTVIVGNGTYVEAPYLSHSGTSGARITIKSQNQWGATIAPNSTQVANASGIIVSFAGQYITLQDFEIVGPSDGSANDGVKAGGTNSTGAIVKGNKIHHIGTGTGSCQAGGAILSGAPNTIFDSNLIYDIGQTNVPGCYAEQGVYLDDGNGQSVTNNVITNLHSTATAISMNGGNSVLNFPSNTVVANNTIVGAGLDGIYINCYASGAGACDNNDINNNILVNVNTSGNGAVIYEAQNPSGTLGNHNLYYNNLVYASSGFNWVNGNANYLNIITSNPLFVNNTGTETGDYHLQSTSPAIDKGTSIGAPNSDFSGGSRPQGSAYDIGAYEFSPSATPPPAPTGLTSIVN